MPQYFTNSEIVAIVGVPETNVATVQPLLNSAMAEFDLVQLPDMIAAIATIGTEVPAYLPVPEWSDGSEYEGRIDLGNTTVGFGRKYKGRGLIQITGFNNYEYFGKALGIDLVNNPDLALDPKTSARILAKYFLDRGVAQAARAGSWEKTRILINGGTNGLQRYLSLVNAFLAIPPIQTQPLPHNPKVLVDTELRSLPILQAVEKPIILVKAGETVTKLGVQTPHWAFVRTQTGHKGWLFRANITEA